MSHSGAFATLQCQCLGTAVPHRVASNYPSTSNSLPRDMHQSQLWPSLDTPFLPQLLQEIEQENLLVPRAALE